jgi:NADPH:quinone reductase-like Zn-dependent oxidoreductase
VPRPVPAGSDLAGVVAGTGPGVTSFSAGDEVIGWQDACRRLAEGRILGKIALLP